MIKKILITSISLLLIFSLVSPTLMSAKYSGDEKSIELANHDKGIEKFNLLERYENIQEGKLELIEASHPKKLIGQDTSQYINQNIEDKNSINPSGKMKVVKNVFSKELQKITAYFYPEYLSLLNKSEQLQVVQWDTVSINEMISKLKKKDYELLEAYSPIAIVQYEYIHDRDAYQKKHPVMFNEEHSQTEEKAAKSNKVDILSANSFRVTEFNNEYNYSVHTDQLVDSLYRTANRSMVDLFLAGKPGLDIELVRNYNSLQAKILQPEYNTVLSGNHFIQDKGNLANPVKPEEKDGFIATGWAINLPTLSHDTIKAEVENWRQSNSCPVGYNGTGLCYEDGYSLKSITPYEKAVFSLENGFTIEFRDGIAHDYPYQNVTFSKPYNSSTGQYEYKLEVDGILSYFFDDKGNIIRKINQFGDEVTYSHSPSNIIITDSYGRKITIFKNSNSVITGFKAEDGNNIIKHLDYNQILENINLTYRKWTESGYQHVTENISYWKLLDVTNVTSGTEIESYTYYTVDSTKLADFNFRPDRYSYKSTPTGEIATSECCGEWSGFWSWSYDDKILETQDVDQNSRSSFGETAYLLLKKIHLYNGLDVQFNYENYNTNWYTYHAQLAEVARGTTRLYQDPFVLQFIGYHAVARVDYIYSENGVQRLISDYWINHHKDHGYQFKEYWKNEKTNIPRLRNTSRFGHKQTIEKQTLGASGDINSTYSHYWNNGIDFVLTYAWNSQTNSNDLKFTENGKYYDNRWDQVVYNEYDEKQIKPKKVSRFVYHFRDYSYQEGNMMFDPAVDSNVQNPFIEVSRDIDPIETALTLINSYTYDNWGNVLTITDGLGNITTYEYNGPFHQISKTTKTSQDLSTKLIQDYEYYDSNHSDANKRNQLQKLVSTQEYEDAIDDLVRKDIVTKKYTAYHSNRQPLQLLESAVGHQFGNETTVTEIDYMYTDRGKVLSETTKVTLRSGEAVSSITLNYDYYINGNIKSVTYPDNSLIEYDYDHLNRVRSRVFQPINAAAKTISVSYDDLARKTTVTDADGQILETYYSPFGLEIKGVQKVGSSTRITFINENENGKRATRSMPFGAYELRTDYSYDGSSRLKSQTNSLGHTITYYSANTMRSGMVEYMQDTRRVIYPDGKEETSYYDPYGRLEKFEERNPEGSKRRTTTYTYSPLGQVIQKEILSNDKSQITRYTYNGSGNLILLKDNIGHEHRYVYNRFGRVIEYYINEVLQKQYEYNEVGWLLSRTNAAEVTEEYEYNSLGNINKFIDKGEQTYSYTYTPYYETDRMTIKDDSDNEIFWEQNVYDANTRLLTQITNSENETIGYGYDLWKRNNVKVIAGNSYKFDHDDYDRLTKIKYPNDDYVRYEYDGIGRFDKVYYKEGSSSEFEIADYSYNTGSNQNKYTISYPGNLSMDQERDAFKELVSVNHYSNNINPNWTEEFVFDGFGNIAKINRNNQHHHYDYDGMNRIKTENATEGINTYDYDDRGNRIILESSTFKYDDNVFEYSYNPLNQLNAYNDNNGTNAQYTYYPDGLRATKNVNGSMTRYVYVNGNIVEELDANGNSIARNIWGNELLYRKDNRNSGRAGHYFYNGHGDVVRIVDADGSGDELKSYEYDIWGNIVIESTHSSKQFNNPFKYAGEPFDEESGLYYLRARYYDPSIGRFITEDTYEGTITNPLSLNLYTYVENNPIRWIDPSGHVKDSDNEELAKLVNPFTKQWERANDTNCYGFSICEEYVTNQKRLAEQSADEVRRSYYNKIDQELPDDIRYTECVRDCIGNFIFASDITQNWIGGMGPTGKVAPFRDLATKYNKHVVVNREFLDEVGNIITDSQYVKQANELLNTATKAASRVRDKASLYFNEATDELVIVKQNIIETYYRIDLETIKKHGFQSIKEYWEYIIK
jgi:RHS repeat-associated protein